jgi:membrane-anchored mycosin MYCP
VTSTHPRRAAQVRRAGGTHRATRVVAGATVAAGLAIFAPTGAAAARPLAQSPAGLLTAAVTCEEGRVQYVTDIPTALGRLSAPDAWATATGATVTVAVVDSGVAAANAHFTDDVILPGKSFVGGSPIEDRRGHGTAVAGIIAARSIGPRSGLVGLAPGSRILPVKVVPDDGDADARTDPATLAAGIRWAADRDAQIIAVALSTAQDDSRLRDAVRYATEAGSLVVASAGNRRTADNAADGPRYPAGHPEAVAVAAIDENGRVTGDSVHGEHVDVAAPGRDVLTTFGAWGDCYLSQQGESTSYATGYVAATAALVAQRFSQDGPARWKHRIEVTASRDRRDARDDRVGWGVVRPVEALTSAIDARLAGPPPPGVTTRQPADTARTRIDIEPVTDPRAQSRLAVLWVGVLAGAGILGLALARLARQVRAR